MLEKVASLESRLVGRVFCHEASLYTIPKYGRKKRIRHPMMTDELQDSTAALLRGPTKLKLV